ncbi:MAG: hypothetical protein QM692_12435 [Thermomicrobiales bacterium]
MDSGLFDDLTRRVGATLRRRSLVAMLAAAPVAMAAAPDDGDAKKQNANNHKKHNKGKKRRYCLNGKQYRTMRKQRKRRLRRQGATRGKCPATPSGCNPPCPAGSFCEGNTCTPCSVTCTGSAAECGAALTAALLVGGRIQLCPGRYGGTFTVGIADTSVRGAGNDNDAATSSILDGQQAGSTVFVSANTPATVENLRITGGTSSGLVVKSGNPTSNPVTVRKCVITGNASSSGGGIAANNLLALIDSQVTGNTATTSGGGLAFGGDTGTAHTVTNSVVSGNSCTGTGGGVFNSFSNVTFTGSTISGNSAPDGGGIHNDYGGTASAVVVDATSKVTNNTATGTTPNASGIWNVTPNVATATGATVTGNTPLPQCLNVTGC